MVFGRARLLNGLATTPISNRGCQPALYGEGLAALVIPAGVSPRVLCAVVAVLWSLSDLETTRDICGLVPGAILCSTPIKVSKSLLRNMQ